MRYNIRRKTGENDTPEDYCPALLKQPQSIQIARLFYLYRKKHLLIERHVGITAALEHIQDGRCRQN